MIMIIFPFVMIFFAKGEYIHPAVRRRHVCKLSAPFWDATETSFQEGSCALCLRFIGSAAYLSYIYSAELLCMCPGNKGTLISWGWATVLLAKWKAGEHNPLSGEGLINMKKCRIIFPSHSLLLLPFFLSGSLPAISWEEGWACAPYHLQLASYATEYTTSITRDDDGAGRYSSEYYEQCNE